MLVLSNILGAESKGLSRPTAVTIGNFDGCHIGHQRLINSILSLADELKATSTVLTFEPRPEAFFQRKTPETLLFRIDQKQRALAELGIQATILQCFDDDFSKIEAEMFLSHYLIKELGAKALVVGSNFRFGRARSGSTDTLRSYGKNSGTLVSICESSNYGTEIISSSRIRHSLTVGNVAEARAMLGRPYILEGIITKGDQLGRKLDAPTANLSSFSQIVPATGVYFVRAFLGVDAPIMAPSPSALPAVCSISLRPTLLQNTPSLRVETHILVGNYELDSLYGNPLSLYFDDKVREDQKFENLEELKKAIALDIATARRYYDIPFDSRTP